MQELTYLVALASVVVYGLFVFIPKGINRTGYLLGDILMGVVLIYLLTQDSGACERCVLIISLIWLVCNYAVGISRRNLKWFACDGFAAASVLSHIRLPMWNLWI